MLFYSFAGVIILALLFPNVMDVLFPPWLGFISNNQKTKKIIKITNGENTLKIATNADSSSCVTAICPRSNIL